MHLLEKQANLFELIKKKKSVVVAYSGGVDSSYLCKVVFDLLGSNSLAVTVDSILTSRSEIEQAQRLAAEIGIPHRIIKMSPLNQEILNNDEQRCYYCKKTVFGELVELARLENISTLFDGSNLDDLSDYRPGMKALNELKIESPLLLCGFSKQDIRTASRDMGLTSWDHPSMACLASRIPYQTRLTESVLSKVEKAENYLNSLGFKQLRVRVHKDLARIEMAREEQEKCLDLALMDRISKALKQIGFKYVALDLDGYQTGKMNPVRSDKSLS